MILVTPLFNSKYSERFMAFTFDLVNFCDQWHDNNNNNFIFLVLTQVHLSKQTQQGREAAKRHSGHPVCHHPITCCQTP